MSVLSPVPNHSPGPNEEELDARDLGFWLYLMTDAVIFALLFATYVTMFFNTAEGPTAIQVFDLQNVFVETMFLLTSSVTFGFASLSSLRENRSGTTLWLAVTIIFGLGFIVLELREFVSMIEAGAGPQVSGFLTAFFTLVGTHGLHVSLGMVGILVMIVQIRTKGLTSSVKSRLHRLGMFWHFLDIVWIGIFSIVYMPAWLL